VDHAATMRRTYERINVGDIAGFGDLVADDFVEHQGGPGLPPTKEGTLEFFGMVCEHWGAADMLSLMQQLGAVPAGPPA
jgi:ketosteroid isomerase-like protein